LRRAIEAHRAENQGDIESRNSRGIDDPRHADVMNEIEAVLFMKSLSDGSNRPLPHQIVGLYPARQTLPSARPPREIEIVEDEVWNRVSSQSLFDGAAVVRTRQDVNFVSHLGDGAGPGPPHIGL
jgi:hypothetical protein